MAEPWRALFMLNISPHVAARQRLCLAAGQGAGHSARGVDSLHRQVTNAILAARRDAATALEFRIFPCDFPWDFSLGFFLRISLGFFLGFWRMCLCPMPSRPVSSRSPPPRAAFW